MTEQVCKTCKRIVEGKECVVCKSKDLTRNWKGIVIIYDTDSKTSEISGLSVPGKYAIRIV